MVCRPSRVQFPGAVYNCNQGPLPKHLSTLHFLYTQCLQLFQKMLLLPTPVWQTARENSPELCRWSRPVTQIMIMVFHAFTQSFLLVASFQIKSLLTCSSNDSAMIPRSLSKRSGKGNLEQNSRDKASSTMMKSSRLSTQPWWTLTFTLNSSLYSSPTRTWVCTLAYIPCTTRTIHSSTPSFLSAHQMTFWGTPSDASPGLQKPCRVSCWQLYTSLAAAFVQRLHLLCLCLGYSQTGNYKLTPTVWGGPQSCPGLSWPALSALDHVSFPFSMHLLCLCLGQSQTGNRRLTPTVWWGSPQSSPGLSWPALSALDYVSFPFSMHPPYLYSGRQWNSASSKRVSCHCNRLQLQGHKS